MELKEFQGTLKKIHSTRLIKKNTSSDIDNFFLVLGAVYNDLKGLILLGILLGETCKKPEAEEISVHAGEYSGLRVQLNKLLISTIHEFFVFLEKNKKVFATSEFGLILKALPKKEQEVWHDLTGIAFKKNSGAYDFTLLLTKIRNNAGFHYYQSGKEFRNAFISRFFEKEKKSQNKNDYAYYSIGKDMEHTRFFYIDATIEEYMSITLDSKEKDSIQFSKLIGSIIEEMNSTIILLLREYLRTRPH